MKKMKKKVVAWFLVLAMMAAYLPASTKAYAEEAVAKQVTTTDIDVTFEESDLSQVWTLRGAGIEVSTDYSHENSGHSIKLTKVGANGAITKGLQMVSGTTYTVSFYYKLVGVSSDFKLRVGPRGTAFQEITGVTYGGTATTEWLPYEKTVTASGAHTWLDLYYQTGTGTVYVDNIKITHEETHNVLHVPAVEATSEAAGNQEYWKCVDSGCNKVWSDEACTVETTLAAVTIPKIEPVAKQVPTTDIDVTFEEADLSQVWTLRGAGIEVSTDYSHENSGHSIKLTKVGANGAITKGLQMVSGTSYTISFYYKLVDVSSDFKLRVGPRGTAFQEIMGVTYGNAATTDWLPYTQTVTANSDHTWLDLYYQTGTGTIYVDDIKITHEVTHNVLWVPAKEATIEADGNLEHWKCVDDGCGKVWSDEDCTVETTLEAVTIPKIEPEAKEVATTDIDVTFEESDLSQVWTLRGAGIEVSTDYSHENSGHSIKLTKVGANGAITKGLQMASGTTYTVSFYYKLVGVSSDFKLRVGPRGTAFQEITGVTYGGTATTEWLPYEKTVTASGDHTWLDLYYQTGTGTVYVDDIKITHNETHHVFHVLAKEATTTEDGNYEYWYCVDDGCGKVWSDEDCTVETTLEAVTIPKVAPVAKNVSIPVWTMDFEGQTGNSYAVLSSATIVTNQYRGESGHSLKLSASGHRAQLYDGFAMTTGKTYTVSFWYKSENASGVQMRVGARGGSTNDFWNADDGVTVFRPTDGNTEWVSYEKTGITVTSNQTYLDFYYLRSTSGTIYVDDVTVSTQEEHMVLYVPAKEATITSDGNIAYWKCTDAGYEDLLWTDAECTQVATLDDVTIPMLSGHTHVGVEVPAKAATATTYGNIAYWTCSGCDKIFSDAACTTETTLAAVTTPKIAPSDHTPSVPSGYYPSDVLSKSTFADEGTSISLNRTTRDENNVAKLGVVATDNYIWTGQIPQTVGKAYKLTFYVLVQEADGLVFDVRNTSGAAIDTALHDNLLAAGEGTKFTAKVDDVISNASFTAPTDGWKKVEITWEADTADNIRMVIRCSGSGTVYVDDWVLYTYEEESPVSNNTPNASEDYLGNLSASEDFEEAPNGSSYTYVTPFNGSAWVEGKNALKVPVNGEKDYLYTIRIAETTGHAYEMSFYVWVEKASNLALDVRRTNAGYSATVTDKLLTASGYTATINGVAATGSISAVTSGWQKVVIKWTATQTTNSSSTGERFAIRAYGSGTGTVWVDDFIIKDTTKAGTFGMDAGTVSLPQGDAGAQHTNIPMTEGSLEGLTSEAYMQIMYAGTESAYVEFTGFTKEDAQAVDFRLYAIRTASGDKVFQIQWKTLEIADGDTIVLKKGLPVKNGGNTWVLDADYTYVIEANAESASGFAASSIKIPDAPAENDVDGNNKVDATDLKWYRQVILGVLNLPDRSKDLNGDGKVNSADYVHLLKKTNKALDDLTETMDLAYDLANDVQAYFVDGYTDYTVKNQTMTLTEDMNNSKKVSSFTNASGTAYPITMDPYAVINNGSTIYGSSSSSAGRVNTTKIGYYYYDVNIRDMKFNGNLYLEKTYHTFSDKMHQAYRVIADGASVNVTTFGLETQITSSTAVEIYDGTNTYTSVASVPAGADIQYVAAKTSAGVVGFIFAGDDTNVSVTTSGNAIVIKQSIAPGTLADGSEAVFGNRLYTDATQDFAGIQAANNEEQNPLTAENITVNENVDGSKFLGYNHLTGAYDFQVNGSGLWAYAEDSMKQKKFASYITVDGAEDDRRIYLCVNMDQIMEGATLVDAANKLVPIPLQGTKNMSDVTEEPIYNATDARHGATYMPLSVKADNKYQFTILNVYETWGNFRMKQLSSVDYYTSYYHISTGVTETTCIAPYSSAYRKDGAHTYFNIPWFLPDFRGMSSQNQYVDSSNRDPVQKNSSGTIFLPTNNKNHTMDSKYQLSDIKSSGLTYVDLDHTYVSNDGNYKYTMRHVEMPQNDETRTYYTIDIEILKDCTLNQNTFNIIGIGSRGKASESWLATSARYQTASYLNESGADTEVSTPGTYSSTVKNYALHTGSSYFTLYDLNTADIENANVGVIVKSCQRVGTNGSATDLALSFQNHTLSVDYWGGKITYGGLTLANNTTFSAGEHIVANLILLPYGNTEQTNADNVKKVYEDSVTNALQVSVVNGVGTVVEDTFIPTVKSNGSKAQFTVSGGTSATYDTTDAGVNYTMKVTGFTKLAKPVVQEYVNGSWVRYDLSTDTALGCDGYAVERAADGTYTYSFVFNKQHNVDRIFAVSAN